MNFEHHTCDARANSLSNGFTCKYNVSYL